MDTQLSDLQTLIRIIRERDREIDNLQFDKKMLEQQKQDYEKMHMDFIKATGNYNPEHKHHYIVDCFDKVIAELNIHRNKMHNENDGK